MDASRGWSSIKAECERRVRESFGRQGLMRHLAARLTALEPGGAEIRVAHSDVVTQQNGYFHGGVSAAIADTACGYAAYTLTTEEASVLTTEFKINLLAPAEGEELVARARVVRAGRTLTICAAEVHVLKNGAEVHCATVLATIFCVQGKSDQGR
jgi:uncharacterized protein (TIGR00369 family)